MKKRTLFLALLALPALAAVLAVSAVVATAAGWETTLVIFNFQNATAGVGDNLGDLIVPAAFLHWMVFTSGTFSWTDPNGIFPDFSGTFYDHGVQNFGWDSPADNVYSARGTGPSSDFSSEDFPDGTSHFVITLAAKKPWVLTRFSMQQGANDDAYWVDIIAVQGNVRTVLGAVSVGGGPPSVVSLSGLSYPVAKGPMQILILPQRPSPSGSGYLAVDDIHIMGRWNPPWPH